MLKILNKGFWLSTGGDYKTRNPSYPTHTGMDYTNVDQNTAVLAVATGKVIKVENSVADPLPPKNGIDYKGVPTGGNSIYIQYGNCINRLCHLKYNTIKVRVGDIVYKGTELAIMGNTGLSTGMHLHFEIQINGQPVDPKPYLDEVKRIENYNNIQAFKKGDIVKIVGYGNTQESGLGQKAGTIGWIREVIAEPHLEKPYPYRVGTGTITTGFFNADGLEAVSVVAESNTYHCVVKGETLWGLARYYLNDGSRWSDIKLWNNLANDTIYAGQNLIVRR